MASKDELLKEIKERIEIELKSIDDDYYSGPDPTSVQSYRQRLHQTVEDAKALLEMLEGKMDNKDTDIIGRKSGCLFHLKRISE